MSLYLSVSLLVLRSTCVLAALVDPSADAVGNISCTGETSRHVCPSDLTLVGDLAIFEKANTSTECYETDSDDTMCHSLPTGTDRSCFWRHHQCAIDVPSEGLPGSCARTWDYAVCEDCVCVQANQSTDICDPIRTPSTQSGFLWSPDYPDAFGRREEPCTITISLEDPERSYLLIQVEVMVFGNHRNICYTEPNADYLKIDATSRGITSAVSLLCHEERVNVTARGEHITLTFYAGSTTPTRRFLVSYRVFPENKTATTETPVSTSTASEVPSTTPSEVSPTHPTEDSEEDRQTPPRLTLFLFLLLLLPVILGSVAICVIYKRKYSNINDRKEKERPSDLDTRTEMTSIPDNRSSATSYHTNSFQNAVNGLNTEYDHASLFTKDPTTECSAATNDVADNVTIGNGVV